MPQQSCRLLQDYCSTHLLYLIAHETTSAIKFKNIYFIAAFILFIAHKTTSLRAVEMEVVIALAIKAEKVYS